MSSYQNRVIAFLDVLGFGSLVESSSRDSALQAQIWEALTSIQPETIHQDAYVTINHDLVPEEEKDSVEEIAQMATKNIRAMHPVCITYFSDSLVISAEASDPLASQMILDMVAKLSIRLWQDHALLIRGGITHGSLTHQENGPLFGPAMNRAYYLESRCAIYPRVLIDEGCLNNFRRFDTFRVLESLIEQDHEYNYLSLATALRHIINDSTLVLAGETGVAPYRELLFTASGKVGAIAATFEDESIQKKYVWLQSELKSRTEEVENP